MAGVGVNEFARFRVDDAHEEGDESIVGAVGGDGFVEAADFAGQIVTVLKQHLDAGLQAGHQQRRGHAFPRNVADQHADAAVGKGEVIVIIAADGAACFGAPAISSPGATGDFSGSRALLDHRGLLHILRHGALRLFDFVEAGVLDADGGDVGHDGEQFRSSRENSRIRCGEST